MVAWLAGSQVRDGTDALSDLDPPGRLDGPARTIGRREGRRATGPAPGGRGSATSEPETEAGLGRQGSAGRLGPAAPRVIADQPAGHTANAAPLASPAGPLAVDLSQPQRPAAYRRSTRGADRADGAGEPGLGLPADPGRTARPGVQGQGLHGAA